MTPLTPCAEARQAALDAADVALEHGCGLYGAVSEALTAALPHLRRQIRADVIAECVAVIEVMLEHWSHPMQGHAVLTAARGNLRALLDAPTKEGDDA